MSEFIKLDRCLGIEKCGKCIQICPVSIFTSNGDYPKEVEGNEDECTLCNLCIQGCEVDAITIHKLYEECGSSATKAQRHKQLKIDH